MPTIRTLRRRVAFRTYWLPLLVLACVTLPHLGQGDWRGDQAWYAAIAAQAWRTGELWTLAAWPGELYFKKPPLVFWIHGLVLDVFGMSLHWARLPTVAAAGLCVAGVVATARALGGRRVAIAAGVALALQYEFFRRTREISLDMWQAAFLVWAAWAFVVSCRRGGVGWAAAAGAAVGLTLMTKPLVGLVIVPMLVIWAIGRVSLGGLAARVGLVFAAAGAVALPWHLGMWFEHGDAFVSTYFGQEIGQRAAGGLDGGGAVEPWWFYLQRLGTGCQPWSLLALLALVSMVRRMDAGRHGGLLRLGVVWTCAWLVLLSLFTEKRDRYMLPVMAGVSWLAAVWLVHWGWAWLRGLSAVGLRRGAGWVAAAGVLFAVAPVRVQPGPSEQWRTLRSWVEASGVRDPRLALDDEPRLLNAGVEAQDLARVYVWFRWWPATPEAVGGVRPTDFLLYEARHANKPGPDEALEWVSGRVTVTRPASVGE